MQLRCGCHRPRRLRLSGHRVRLQWQPHRSVCLPSQLLRKHRRLHRGLRHPAAWRHRSFRDRSQSMHRLLPRSDRILRAPQRDLHRKQRHHRLRLRTRRRPTHLRHDRTRLRTERLLVGANPALCHPIRKWNRFGYRARVQQLGFGFGLGHSHGFHRPNHRPSLDGRQPPTRLDPCLRMHGQPRRIANLFPGQQPELPDGRRRLRRFAPEPEPHAGEPKQGLPVGHERKQPQLQLRVWRLVRMVGNDLGPAGFWHGRRLDRRPRAGRGQHPGMW